MIEKKPLEIIIIGLGASGLYASKSALGYNRNCHVTIIEKRDFDQFSPCGLPFVIEGVVKDFEMLKHDVPEIKNKLTKLLKHEVKAIDPEKKTVTAVDLDNREEKVFGYDALILATGATPVNLPIPGAKEFVGQGVHFVSTIDNSKALQEAVRTSRKKSAVVVGGGAIGLEVAVGLKALGLEVAVTKRTEPPFPRNLDPAMGSKIVEKLESLDIRVLFGKGIDSVNGSDGVESVTIAGEEIPCDIVVMAVGMRANIYLAEAMGCKIVNRAVAVNNRMETSIKDIYAIGDVVSSYSRIDHTPATMQLATSAFRMGISAGINAAGGNTTYPGVLNTFLTSVGSLEIAGTGYTLEVAKELGYKAKAVGTRRENKPHYMPGVTEINLRVIVEEGTGKILGAQAIAEEGAGARINVFALAIHGNMTLYDLMDAELSYYPAVSQMYDPIAQVVDIAMKRLKLGPKGCDTVFFPESR